MPIFKDTVPDTFDFKILVDDVLSLALNKPNSFGPLILDFERGSLNYRRRFGGRHLILRAVGGAGQRVFDATLGLGRDAFILASLGCQVLGVEKNVPLFILVKDGLARTQGNAKLKAVVDRLEISLADSHKFIDEMEEKQFDAIYLDPMFPAKPKTALPKKELQILQALVGIPQDERESLDLLESALKKSKRVVVKRPVHGPPLRGRPDQVFEGESTRFDVYLA